MPKMATRWPNLAPRWGQDGAKMPQDGACLAILRPIGELSWAFWGSWGRSLQKWPEYKNEHHSSVLATFSGLGGSGWRLSELSWGILARSWASLGDLGVKLGPCWQHVGGKMAKKSEDMRTWGENGWLKATNDGSAADILARVGRCLELEFRDLERLDGLDTRSNTPWHPLRGGRRISRALRATSRHRART